MALSFRTVPLEEEELVARILCNAFLPLWNHNWFQNVSEPLEPVPVTPTLTAKISPLQKARVEFYLDLVRATRLAGGSVTVAIAPDPPTDASPISAVLLWLPPKVRWGPLDIGIIYRSGFLSLIRKYGLRGFYRINFVFEANVEAMFATTTKKFGVKAEDCGFVQMVACNPQYAGKGYASRLLARQIELHQAEFPGVPVVLDTTTQQGIRVYERLGFKLFGEKKVATGTDKIGIKLKEGAGKDVMAEAEGICIQRVMIKIPNLAIDDKRYGRICLRSNERVSLR